MNGKKKRKIVSPKQKKKTVLQKMIEDVRKEKEELKAKQELFCKLYATDDSFFANGVQAYLEVYDVDRSKPKWYQTACACASRLLSNAKVFNRINELLEKSGLNDAYVDKQLLFLISQQSDFGAKAQAIREYNKLKARITEKIDHTTKGKALPSPIYGSRSTV
jgi:hypothetical protein